MENTRAQGFDFNSKSYLKRLFIKGKCDEMVTKIVNECGWSEEFESKLK